MIGFYHRILILSLIITVAAAWPQAALSAQGMLDGKTFVGEVGENGKRTGDPEEIFFAEGRFRSGACDKFGFGDSTYTAFAQEGVVVFEAETTSPTKEKMKWHGEVIGDILQGYAFWSQEGKEETKEYWFKCVRR